jgi:hypothetical protein
MAVFDADVVCGIEPMQSALKHSCQLPSVCARTGFAAILPELTLRPYRNSLQVQ